MLLVRPDLKILNSARRSNRGTGLFLLASGDPGDPNFSSKLVVSYDLPHHHAATQIHVVLVLTSKNGERLALEFFRDQVRTIGAWPTEPAHLMLPALRQSYSQVGLHFVFAPIGLGLSSEYRFSHVIVAPTIADFSAFDLLESLLVSSVPTAFCSKRGIDKNGNPLYGVDYSKLLSEER